MQSQELVNQLFAQGYRAAKIKDESDYFFRQYRVVPGGWQKLPVGEDIPGLEWKPGSQQERDNLLGALATLSYSDMDWVDKARMRFDALLL